MSDAIPIFEAKNKLPFFVHKAEIEGPVFLSRRNKEVAVIISKAEYEKYLQFEKTQKKKSFAEKILEFRKNNENLFENNELYDSLMEGIKISRENANLVTESSEHIFDGLLEDAND